MMDTKARREAEEAYPPTEHTAWNGLKYQAMPFKEREGYTKAALKYLPQLSEKDKVIEGLRKGIENMALYLEIVRDGYEPTGSSLDWHGLNKAMEDLTELLSSLAPTGTR